MKKIILLLLFTASAIAADAPVYYYPYSGCEAVKSTYAYAEKDIELRRAGERIIQDYISGAYSSPFDTTGGNTLYLFPDKRAMLSDRCDICPTKLAAEGEWKTEAGSVIITWKKWCLDEKSTQFFIQRNGKCASLALYLTFGPRKNVKDILLVSKDKEGPEIKDALIQKSRYIDWKNIADDLSNKPKGSNF